MLTLHFKNLDEEALENFKIPIENMNKITWHGHTYHFDFPDKQKEILSKKFLQESQDLSDFTIIVDLNSILPNTSCIRDTFQ